MAWEHRGRRTYFYRARKLSGRVVKEYLGAGELALRSAAADAAQRQYRAELADAVRQQSARLDELAQGLDDALSMILGRAVLLLGSLGFHKHRGEWRRQRR